MVKLGVETQGAGPVWVGLDWGQQSHAVAVVNEAREVVASFTLGAVWESLQQLPSRLQALGVVGGVAIESTRELVVNFLLGQGWPVYLINPKMSRHWRAGQCVAEVKSDARDGQVLALELSRRHESLHALTPGDPAVAELAGLCEKRRALVDERTALVQRLKATLRLYYPAALAFFDNWVSPAAWRFVKRFPTAPDLMHARKNTLIAFLKANRIGLKPVWLERIDGRAQACAWPQPRDHAALAITAQATIAQLLALEVYINQIEKLVAEHCKSLPQAALMESLPGAGARLAPALTAMAATLEGEPERLQAMRCLSGVAPVQNQSGKRRQTNMRHRCNKGWRDTLHLFAFCSTQSCAWAKAFYQLCRERGDNFATALRKLADKWLKIIHRMLDTNQPYDEKRYLRSLRNTQSPVYKKLCENNGG